VLGDEVVGQVDCIVYRLIGSVGKLQGVQEGVGDLFEVCKHKSLKGPHNHRGQSNGLKSLSPVDLGFLGTGMTVEVLKQACT